MRKIILCSILLLAPAIHNLAQDGNWMTGTWQGKGREVEDGSTWSMHLNVRSGKYLIEYPSLKCGGEWTLLRLWSRSARLTEKIKYGMSDCQPVGTVIIKRLKNKSISFSYFYPGTKKAGAYAILYKQRR